MLLLTIISIIVIINIIVIPPSSRSRRRILRLIRQLHLYDMYREFKDVVSEDVVLDDNSFVTLLSIGL